MTRGHKVKVYLPMTCTLALHAVLPAALNAVHVYQAASSLLDCSIYILHKPSKLWSILLRKEIKQSYVYIY